MALNRRKVVEVFLGGDADGRRLLERIFRLPLRDCMVQVRPHHEGPGSPGMVVVDGETVVSDEDGRLSTRVLRQAVLADPG